MKNFDSARDKTYLDRANDLEQLMQRDPMSMLGKGTKIEVRDEELVLRGIPDYEHTHEKDLIDLQEYEEQEKNNFYK